MRRTCGAHALACRCPFVLSAERMCILRTHSIFYALHSSAAAVARASPPPTPPPPPPQADSIDGFLYAAALCASPIHTTKRRWNKQEYKSVPATNPAIDPHALRQQQEEKVSTEKKIHLPIGFIGESTAKLCNV